MKNHFEYSVPYRSELRDMYITPYKFSDELRDYTHYMFSHPVHNKHNHALYSKWVRPTDVNDMLKIPYLMIRYFQDHPQQYDHALNNIVPHMVVAMWKTFLGLNKTLRQVPIDRFYKTNMDLIKLAENKFLDIFLSDIETQNLVYHIDDMVKRREGVGLREQRKATQEGSKHFEYLCSLT